MSFTSSNPDLDAITRNLVYLNLGHITLEEATAYKHELSAIASLNEAIETIGIALRTADPPDHWHRIYADVSSAAALLSSAITPLIDLNAEREAEYQLEEAQAEEKLGTKSLAIAHL